MTERAAGVEGNRGPTLARPEAHRAVRGGHVRIEWIRDGTHRMGLRAGSPFKRPRRWRLPRTRVRPDIMGRIVLQGQKDNQKGGAQNSGREEEHSGTGQAGERQGMRWLGLGVEFMAVMGLFTWAGWKLDERWGHGFPWLAVVGFVVSFVGMTWLTVKDAMGKQ